MPDPPSRVTSSTPLPRCWDATPEPDSACLTAHRGTVPCPGMLASCHGRPPLRPHVKARQFPHVYFLVTA